MKRQFAAFVILNLVVAVLAALVALLIWRATRSEPTRSPSPTPAILQIPVTPVPRVTVITATPAAAPSATMQTHTVLSGENCSTIAETYGVPLGDLLRANALGAACLIYPGDTLVIPSADVGDIPTQTPQPRDRVIVYTVQPGDSVFGIALKFGLRPESLFWANQDTLPDVHLLSIGQALNIPPVDGVLHIATGAESVAQIAAQYNVDPDAILVAYNDLTGATRATIPRAGVLVMVPGAEGEVPEDLFRQPIPDTPAPGEAAAAGAVQGGFAPGHPGSCGWVAVTYVGTGVFRWPLPGFSVWADFADPWHRGIDLGGVPGVPVWAADNGTVIFAGWNNWGYGNMVVLDHGNGFWTLYGHLDRVSLRCGQGVNSGQLVGTLGTTGNTAGPHVHFEIRRNGVPVNPHDYIQ